MCFILGKVVSGPGDLFRALYSIFRVLKQSLRTNNNSRLVYIQLGITFIILYLNSISRGNIVIFYIIVLTLFYNFILILLFVIQDL
jgi:hypothetical protein